MKTNTEFDAWWNIARATVGPVAAASFRIRVAGSENIPRHNGALLAYNHVSVLDAIFVAIPVMRRGRIIRCFGLSEDFERPLMGRAFRALRQVPIRRGAGAWGPLEQLADIIMDGWLAGIAPEGTVGRGEELLPIQKGAAQDRPARQQPRDPGRPVGAPAPMAQGRAEDGTSLPPEPRRVVRPTDLRGGRPEVPSGRAGADRPAR